MKSAFKKRMRQFLCFLGDESRKSAGFTLIETLVAVSFLTVAIVAPMSLTSKSLSTAYYARDQITAFHLAQEAVETIRHVRDGNILQNALGSPTDLLSGIPSVIGEPFIVDARNDTMELCSLGECPPLKTDGTIYGYEEGFPWEPTRFTRAARAEFVGGDPDEVRIAVTVSWQTGSFQTRSFTISENLYRWIGDTTAETSEETGGGEESSPAPQCSDATDNDGDSLIDMTDPGCANTEDDDETNSAEGGEGSGGGGGGSVICTELFRQGRLSPELIAADEAFGAKMPQFVIDGYHVWAKPVVFAMQRSEFVSDVVYVIAEPWAQEMAYQVGAVEEGSTAGKVLMVIGIPLSGLIGIMASLI